MSSDVIRVVEAQLGRPSRSDFEVSATCALGLPVVIDVPPVLEDGTPFPTTYWLTCPLASRRIGRIEGVGGVKQLERYAAHDAEFGTALDEAHARYARERDARLPEVLEQVRQRQRERLERLAVDAEPGRLETELALVSQKLDVDEELDRLQSHVSEIRQILGSAEPVGRRLDFLMQELNREANTLGSKSADISTTQASVELKVLIEQMREQVQNIE